MIQRILVPLDPSPFTTSALEYGCRLARVHGATLTGLVILDIPGIERSIGSVPLGAMHYAEHLEKHRREEASERIHSLLENFREKCAREGVVHREAERQGSPSARIVEDSLYYDLVVMGMRTAFHFETRESDETSLWEVLDHSVTPVFSVPEHYAGPEDLSSGLKVTIAFDGSLSSSRALQKFGHIAQNIEFNVTLLISHSDEKLGRHFLDEAARYLAAHDVSQVKKEWTDEPIREVMERNLETADAIVVGAHSKKGLLKFKFGGLTKYLIDVAKKPVLIGM